MYVCTCLYMSIQSFVPKVAHMLADHISNAWGLGPPIRWIRPAFSLQSGGLGPTAQWLWICDHLELAQGLKSGSYRIYFKSVNASHIMSYPSTTETLPNTSILQVRALWQDLPDTIHFELLQGTILQSPVWKASLWSLFQRGTLVIRALRPNNPGHPTWFPATSSLCLCLGSRKQKQWDLGMNVPTGSSTLCPQMQIYVDYVKLWHKLTSSPLDFGTNWNGAFPHRGSFPLLSLGVPAAAAQSSCETFSAHPGRSPAPRNWQLTAFASGAK